MDKQGKTEKVTLKNNHDNQICSQGNNLLNMH